MTKKSSSRGRKWWRRILTLTVIGLAVLAFFSKSLSSGYLKKKGQAALVNSRLAQAYNAFEHAARLDESDPEARFLLARVCRRMGNFVEMESHLSASLELGFSPARIRRERILAEAQVGRVRSPGKTLSELLLSAQGDEREICLAFVNGLCLNLQFAEALQVLEAWHADFPEDAEPWFRRGIIQNSQKRLEYAEEAFREGLRLQPDRWSMRNYLADCLFQQQEYQQAQDQYRLVLENSPEHAEATFGLARCRSNLGHQKEARNLLEEVVSRDATHTQARHVLARLELESNKPSAAVEWLSPYLEEEYPLPETSHLLIQAYTRLGESETAEKYRQKFLQAQAQLDRLEELFDKIEELQQDVDLRYEVGVLTYRYHSRKEGLAWVQSVLLSKPNHREAREFLQNHPPLHSRKIGRSGHDELFR